MSDEPNNHPIYRSFADYLQQTPWLKLKRRCVDIAKRANRKRLFSKTAEHQVTALQVWHVLRNAKGRCVHCESLAVEGRPSNPTTGSPTAWEQIGRRIGSLEHRRGRFDGGDNDFANLLWSCLLCNNWIAEAQRKRGISHRGILDCGGFYPDLGNEPDAETSDAIVSTQYVRATAKVWSADEAFRVGRKPARLDDENDDFGYEMFPDHECPWDVRMGRFG